MSTGILDNMNDRISLVGKKKGWNVVALHTQDWDDAWFIDQVHLSKEGLRQKAKRIADELVKNRK